MLREGEEGGTKDDLSILRKPLARQTDPDRDLRGTDFTYLGTYLSWVLHGPSRLVHRLPGDTEHDMT